MNIRKKVIFAMTVVAASIVSCKKQEQGPVFPEITDEFQYLGEDNYYLGYNSAEYPDRATLKFKTNLAWHFECGEASEWFDISPVSTDAETKYMENEGILIRDGVMYLMYTAKNKEGIRRPLVFNLAIPE